MAVKGRVPKDPNSTVPDISSPSTSPPNASDMLPIGPDISTLHDTLAPSTVPPENAWVPRGPSQVPFSDEPSTKSYSVASTSPRGVCMLTAQVPATAGRALALATVATVAAPSAPALAPSPSSAGAPSVVNEWSLE